MGSKIHSGRKLLRRKKQMPLIAKHEQEQEQEYAGVPLFDSITKNQEKIKEDLGGSRDISIRKLILNDAAQNEFLIVYIDGIVDDESINKLIVEPLQNYANENNNEKISPEILRDRLVAISSVELISDWGIFYRYLFLCGCMVFINGFDTALYAKVPGGEKRSIEEPKTEMTIRGPKEGFTESLYTNMALIRKKLRSPKLWSEMWTIGKLSQTPVSMIYIKGLADEKVMQTLRDRIEAIDIDGVLETNYIEELITDQKWTLFPTIMNNERPDVVAGMLLEGRIIIMVDGSPFALIMPVALNSFFQAAEDYYQRFDIATFLRMLRFISFFLALLAPSVYVAIVSYHQEMLPTPLLLKLAAQREGVPFPAYLEAFIMEFVFEILREAVLRMPIAAGNTVSIVGGLVIGQSIVEAGIVSPAVVIVVSFTAITSFVSPAYNLGIAARLLRFLLLMAASTLGFYGISLIMLLLMLHLSHLRSIGMPYLKPFAPFLASDWKDSIIRAPIWKMRQRPQLLANKNRQREQVRQPKEERSDEQK